MKIAELDQVIDQVLRTISRYSMLPPLARAGVAVSGGADSIALLHVLHRLSQVRGWSLVILHFNHQLRGPESDEDQRFVEVLAASLALPCFVTSADVRAASQGGNLEQTARNLRYRYFAEVREASFLDAVATGHTASDQAETVLMRLLRGASPASLAGIRAVNAGWIIRPLLELTRDQVRRWLRAEGLNWRDDSSNTENCYDRNRLRNEVLPLLRNEWNPNVEAALARLASLAALDEKYWQSIVEAVWSEAAARNHFGIVVDVERLLREHPALRSRVLMKACSEAAGTPVRLSHEQLERLVALVLQQRGSGRLSLPGIEAWRSFSQILIYKGLTSVAKPQPVTLSMPGAAALEPGAPLLRLAAAGIRSQAYNEVCNLLDRTLAPGPFLLRPWRAGDRCRSSSGNGYSVHRLLQQLKIPVWERVAWPVLEWQGEVVWVRGFGVVAAWRAGPECTNQIEVTEDSAAARG